MTPTTADALAAAALDRFKAALAGPEVAKRLAQGVIGEGVPVDGGFGAKPLIYADYVASGRALRPIETFIMEEVLPYYANSHTEASYCGGFMTRLRQRCREEIGRLCGAGEGYATIFCGSGATAGINRLVALLGVAQAVEGEERPLVVTGPYEHHSNILPWRESGAEVVEIPECRQGGPDLAELERVLAGQPQGRLVIGAFSALSNVTGIRTDVARVTRLLKAHGALSVWDYAGGGPYLAIDMQAGGGLDAVVVSPHKFPGGPGATGLLIVREAAVRIARPSWPGGGTVRFVSPWGHDYAGSLAAREEAGTPNVAGDIRAGLVFLVKEALGQAFLDRRHAVLKQRALAQWEAVDGLELLGAPQEKDSLPVFSFRVRDLERGGYIHQQLVTRMLSDAYGVQARGGCACAGPYAHRLLKIGQEQSDAMRAGILSGEELKKPGWTRLNFSVLLTEEKGDRIIAAVDELARAPYPLAEQYICDESKARFTAIEHAA